MKRKVCIVSDLHMFCSRSNWKAHLHEMRVAADECDLFVFNGDTFDFKWSEVGDEEETVDAAIAFLREFAQRHPDTQFHVNIGNHDHHYHFMQQLEALAQDTENLTWHPYYLRVGNAVFLHGDVAMRPMTQAALERYREQWMHTKQGGKFHNRVYDAAFRTRAHVAVSRLAFPGRLTVKRVHEYLRHIGHGPETGVDQVFFGHTHVRVHGREYRGVRYHNGGAPLQHMEFTLLKATV